MTTRRVARCRCDQLSATCVGEPVRVSVCHCDACKRRTGGAFSAQARFATSQVEIAGEHRVWERVGGSGRRAWYHWCPGCGATVFYENEGMDDLIAIPLGAIVEGDIPMPIVSIWEEAKLPWVTISGDVDHMA